MKILVSDYDKTFYLDDDDLKENMNLVHVFRESGNLFIIATGRSFFDFKKKKDLYNLEYDYVLLNHGATIMDNKDNIIHNEYIKDEDILKIKKDLLLDNCEKYFCCNMKDSRLTIDGKNIEKINVEYYDDELAKKVVNNLNNKYSSIINAFYIRERLIEIVSHKVSKKNALIYLLDYLKLKEYQVYPIGDGYSDIDMIKYFHGFCMDDSVLKLKSISEKSYSSVSLLIKDILGDKL